jgi:DNA-directed RNA polymerase specialized sigma24 family protein
MFDASQPSRTANRTEAATTANEHASYIKLVEGDTYADWEAAYLDNVDRLYRLMCSGVGNRPEAGDLTAQVFKAALGPFRRHSPRDEVRAYLLATARTVLASHWRRRLGHPDTLIDPEQVLPLWTRARGLLRRKPVVEAIRSSRSSGLCGPCPCGMPLWPRV